MDELRIWKDTAFPKPLNEIWENKARTLTGPTPSFPTLKFQVTEAPGAMGGPGGASSLGLGSAFLPCSHSLHPQELAARQDMSTSEGKRQGRLQKLTQKNKEGLINSPKSLT